MTELILKPVKLGDLDIGRNHLRICIAVAKWLETSKVYIKDLEAAWRCAGVRGFLVNNGIKLDELLTPSSTE